MIFVLNNVLVTLVVSALLTLYVEFRVRARTRRICGCDPIFRKLRSGRVRFTLNDLTPWWLVLVGAMLTVPAQLTGYLNSHSAMARVRRQARISMTIDDLAGDEPGRG